MDGKLATKLVAITIPVVVGVPWLSVAAQVVDAIVTHLDSGEFEQSTRTALNDLRYEVGQVSTQVARQTYRRDMGTGCRILRDLPLYRTPEGYQQTVEKAKTEFQRASAMASDLGSSDLVITAELAITGCWYLLQSPDGMCCEDVTNELPAHTQVSAGAHLVAAAIPVPARYTRDMLGRTGIWCL